MARNRRWCTVVLLLSAALCVVLYPRSAAALADLSGRWHVEIDIPVDFNSQTWEVSQTGTDLSVVMSAGAIVQTWTGTIDTGSGAFTLIAPTADPGCPPSEIDAVVNPSSTSFSGVFRLRVNFTGCEEGMFSVEGRRCGNGVLDAGDQCGGNFDDGDAARRRPDGAERAALLRTPARTTPATVSVIARCGRPMADRATTTCSATGRRKSGRHVQRRVGDPRLGIGDCRACNETTHQCHTRPGFRRDARTTATSARRKPVTRRWSASTCLAPTAVHRRRQSLYARPVRRGRRVRAPAIAVVLLLSGRRQGLHARHVRRRRHLRASVGVRGTRVHRRSRRRLRTHVRRRQR